jgi:hypothetical protein
MAAAILAIAFLYSCIGHAGASGYIAVMSLFSLAPEVIRPTALVLNILVACLSSWQFWRAGHFSWSQFWPFALPAVPLAFVGGYLSLPSTAFKVLVGLVLVASAARLLMRPPEDLKKGDPPRSVSLAIGGGIGLLSGLTGTGGGIFLTPILLFNQWARTKPAAAYSAFFILFNSIAGLLGNLSSTKNFPVPALALLAAAGIGGAAGSYLGSRRLAPAVIKRLLAMVLLTAAVKLILT